MKAITIQVSDSDYTDMVAHFAADRPGRPLVAVIAPAGPSGSELQQDIAALAAKFDAAARREGK